MSEQKSKNIAKTLDIIFICSSIIFNISISFLYIAAKFDNAKVLQVLGAIVIFLIIPYTLILIGYLKQKEKRKITISLAVVLIYLFLELLLDFILMIPFRDILVLHIPYIIVFYAAEFSIISVSFDKNKKLGFVVLITFFVLLGCLIYMFVG